MQFRTLQDANRRPAVLPMITGINLYDKELVRLVFLVEISVSVHDTRWRVLFMDVLRQWHVNGLMHSHIYFNTFFL